MLLLLVKLASSFPLLQWVNRGALSIGNFVQSWRDHVVCIRRLELFIVGEKIRNIAQEGLISHHLGAWWWWGPRFFFERLRGDQLLFWIDQELGDQGPGFPEPLWVRQGWERWPFSIFLIPWSSMTQVVKVSTDFWVSCFWTSAEGTSYVGWWKKDLLDWSAWTCLPLPPLWAGRLKLVLAGLCQVGFSSWIGYHGGSYRRSQADRESCCRWGRVLGTGCVPYPTWGCAYSRMLRLRLQSPRPLEVDCVSQYFSLHPCGHIQGMQRGWEWWEAYKLWLN